MNDRDFLIWVYMRLVGYKEREQYDYMRRLRGIIENTPEDKRTDVSSCSSSLHELIRHLGL